MSGRKFATIIGAIFFLLLGLAGLYRLMLGFPIEVGGMHIGQTSSFFVFVICVALSLILFRQWRAAR